MQPLFRRSGNAREKITALPAPGKALAMLVLAAATTLAIAPAEAAQRPEGGARTLVIRNDPGGVIPARIADIATIRASGRKVELRGRYCLSACTLYLGLPNACVSPQTRFGFHGPSSFGRRLVSQDFERWSNVVASHFKPELQQWFMTKARYRINGFYRISGRQLIQMGYASC
mgnify:CR=1 FL=1